MSGDIYDSDEDNIHRGRDLVELRAGRNPAAIVPDSVEGVYRLAQLIIQSQMAPNGYKTPQQVSIAIMTGLELGLTPMSALQSIAVINGRPTLWGDALPGLCRASGKCEYIKEWVTGDGDDRIAYCETRRKDDPTVVMQSFSITDAREAGLLDKPGPWRQYRRRMLQMRARSFCLRDAYGDVLKGLPTREEAVDHPEMLGPQKLEGNPLAAPEMTVEEVPAAASLRPLARDALDALARAGYNEEPKKRRGRPKSDKAAVEHHDDEEEHLNSLARVRAGEEKTYSSEEVKEILANEEPEATADPMPYLSAFQLYQREIEPIEVLRTLETHYNSWLSVITDVEKNDPQMAQDIRNAYIGKLRHLEEELYKKKRLQT